MLGGIEFDVDSHRWKGIQVALSLYASGVTIVSVMEPGGYRDGAARSGIDFCIIGFS